MKKFLATVLALSCAAVMLLGSVGAEKVITDGINDGSSKIDGGNFVYDLAAAGVELEKVASITLTLNVADDSLGFGGGIIANSENYNWDQKEWGNEGADKEFTAVKVSDGVYSVTRSDFSGMYSAEQSYNNVAFSSWWGSDFEVIKIEVKDEAGALIYSSPAAAQDPVPGDDTPQTGDAMNIVVLAALAVVALGGIVVCANKKNA